MPVEPIPDRLVGPRTLILEGITRILTPPRFRVVASASSIDDLSSELLPKDELLLLIIDAGDNLVASIEQIKRFKERYLTGRIAVLADRCQSNEVMRAYGAGTNAYLIKISACNVLIKSLELVMLGETIVSLAILSSVSRSDDRHEPSMYTDASSRGTNAADESIGGDSVSVPKLSAREKCILRCLLNGDANEVIARKVDIAEATVKVHVKAILRKIQVRNRTQAAILAMNCRLFDADMNDGSAASVPNKFDRNLLNRNHSSSARGSSGRIVECQGGQFPPQTLSAMPTVGRMCRIGHRSTRGPLCSPPGNGKWCISWRP
jgi:two-component system, NarL family, nitrate/nitrite response regulator NarL